LIHCNVHDHYPLLRHVARWSGRPIVVTARFRIGPEFGLWAFRPPYLPDVIQFTSRTQLEECQEALPPSLDESRIKLIMNGLDVDDFLSRSSGEDLRVGWPVGEQTIVIGTASTIRPRKRIEDFILLVGRLRLRGLDVVGMIAGGGIFGDQAYWDRLQALILGEGLGPHCLMLGNLDPVAPFMRSIDLFVTTSSYESFGMSVCEAQACGKPAIGYDAGSVRELLPDRWGLVPLGDLDALVEKATTLATDPGLRRRLGEAGRDFVRAHFDAPVLAARQAEIYEEVLAHRPRR
jgi:glycosyltransferase involved in cell wall biosynthesis